jgi:hypothetical protein
LITSANLICKRSVFNKVKFDETLYPGEDPKFISDAKKAGLKVACSPDIIVYNKRREDVISFTKQIYLYGFTRPKKESFSETLKTPFFLVPSAFVIYVLFSPFLYMLHSLLLIPLYIYIGLTILCSFYEAIKNKNTKIVLILFWLFPVLHISYGLGFIFGTLKRMWSKK